jgi:biotin carboxyl carrier protein
MADEQFIIKIGEAKHTIKRSEVESLDIIKKSSDQFHLLYNGKSYNIKLDKSNANSKQIFVELNGTRYVADILDELDSLVEKMGLSSSGNKISGFIKAPMPGLILDVLVESGQSIEKGDPLFILEAMKMENVIKAVDSALVKEVHVRKGQTVDKSQLILELE